nr:hypothetical protein [uncultured organism]
MEADLAFLWSLLLAAPAVPAVPARFVALPAGERLQRLDDFRDSLPAAERRRLDRALPRSAGGGIARCDNIERSRASCESAAYLPALRVTGLLPRFLATLRTPGDRATGR